MNISSQHDTALQGANVNADRLIMNVGNNLSIESRQDSNQYDSKQTQASAGVSIAIYGSGSNASINASRNKAKLNYAQVEEQSGLSAGEGGLAINVGNHTHLKGGLIESKAEESKNRLHTKTFSTEDIKNHSDVKVESHSVGLSTNMAQNAMSAVATTIGALGNKNESKQSLTQSAVGNNIHFTAESQDEKTQQNLTALSRDTENANQKVQAYDLAEIREQQEMAQVIGEIAQNSINLTLKPKLEEAEKQKAEAEAILANKETNSNQRIQAQRQLDNANQTIQTYGQGGDMQMAIRAVTGLLQGIATKNTGAAAVGLISPYANQFIKAQTGDNTTANLMAHALLGAIEAKATGTNALAGAAGALTGEATAQIIAQKLYGIDGKSKTTNDLSESEKQTITALSQLAGGLAGGIIGDSTTSAVSSADIAKRAVENNHFGTMGAASQIGYAFARNDKDCDDKCKVLLDEVQLNTAKSGLQASSITVAMGISPALMSTSTIITGAIGGSSELIGQLAANKWDVAKVDYTKVGISTAVGALTKNMGIVGTSLTNGGVEFLDAYRTGKDPIYEGISSGVIALGGSALGGKVQRGLDAKFNPISNKYKFEPIAPGVPIYKSPNYNYIPSAFGNTIDNSTNKFIKSEVDIIFNREGAHSEK